MTTLFSVLRLTIAFVLVATGAVVLVLVAAGSIAGSSLGLSILVLAGLGAFCWLVDW